MAYERLPMRKIKEVLRLKHEAGRGHGEIAELGKNNRSGRIIKETPQDAKVELEERLAKRGKDGFDPLKGGFVERRCFRAS